MILAREFQAKNIFKDEIILTRMKKVIEKGEEILTQSKDQKLVNNTTLSVSKVLSVSH